MVRLRSVPRAISRAVLVAALGAFAITSLGPIAHPSPVAATTADTMEASLLTWINDARAQKGLRPLRLLTKLTTFAGDRATTMASTGEMKHPSCLSCMLTDRGIQWYSIGEVLAYNNYPYGAQAAQVIFNGWKGSTMHWGLLMSEKFNYIGLGVAYRSANRATFAAGVLTESKDQTKPWGKVSSTSRSGTTVSWTWTGADNALQTHTSGLKNYDVQYRVDSGSWSTLKSASTTSSLSLTGRAHGHYYGLRVRARDNAGNLSGYSAELRIWVP